jgi:hypothetical protein
MKWNKLNPMNIIRNFHKRRKERIENENRIPDLYRTMIRTMNKNLEKDLIELNHNVKEAMESMEFIAQQIDAKKRERTISESITTKK